MYAHETFDRGGLQVTPATSQRIPVKSDADVTRSEGNRPHLHIQNFTCMLPHFQPRDMTLCTPTNLIRFGLYTGGEFDVAHPAEKLCSCCCIVLPKHCSHQPLSPPAQCTNAPPLSLLFCCSYGVGNSSYMRAPPPPPPQSPPPPPPSFTSMIWCTMWSSALEGQGVGKSGWRAGGPINLHVIEVRRVRQVCQWRPHPGRQYVSECPSHHATPLQHCQQHERHGGTHHWATLQSNGLRTSSRQRNTLGDVCLKTDVLTHTDIRCRMQDELVGWPVLR